MSRREKENFTIETGEIGIDYGEERSMIGHWVSLRLEGNGYRILGAGSTEREALESAMEKLRKYEGDSPLLPRSADEPSSAVRKPLKRTPMAGKRAIYGVKSVSPVEKPDEDDDGGEEEDSE